MPATVEQLARGDGVGCLAGGEQRHFRDESLAVVVGNANGSDGVLRRCDLRAEEQRQRERQKRVENSIER